MDMDIDECKKEVQRRGVIIYRMNKEMVELRRALKDAVDALEPFKISDPIHYEGYPARTVERLKELLNR